MASGVICQVCGIEAPTKHVEFHQNIGALVMRFHRSVKGNLCKSCIHKKFWSMTGITATVGWLGMISIIIAPFFVLNNLIRYVGALGMPAVPPDARAPEVSGEQMQKFMPHSQAAFERLGQKESIGDIARSIAPQIGLTPGQVIKCMQNIASTAERERVRTQTIGAPLPAVPIQPPPVPLPTVFVEQKAPSQPSPPSNEIGLHP
jgi:hypothetical protein